LSRKGWKNTEIAGKSPFWPVENRRNRQNDPENLSFFDKNPLLPLIKIILKNILTFD
jgi:hypothetical protein